MQFLKAGGISCDFLETVPGKFYGSGLTGGRRKFFAEIFSSDSSEL